LISGRLEPVPQNGSCDAKEHTFTIQLNNSLKYIQWSSLYAGHPDGEFLLLFYLKTRPGSEQACFSVLVH